MSSRSSGSKRASWSSAAAPRQPRRHEDVAGGLRPAAGGGAPGEVAGPGAEPVLGLHALAGQVALAVADRLRLARGAGGEDDQRRVDGGRGRAPGAGAASNRRSSGTASSGPSNRRSRDRCPRRARRPPRARGSTASIRARRSLPAAARCRAARQRRSASRQASRRPTRAGCRSSVMTTSPRATPCPPRRRPGARTDPRPRRTRSPSGRRRVERDQRCCARVGGVDDVVGEIHRAAGEAIGPLPRGRCHHSCADCHAFRADPHSMDADLVADRTFAQEFGQKFPNHVDDMC